MCPVHFNRKAEASAIRRISVIHRLWARLSVRPPLYRYLPVVSFRVPHPPAMARSCKGGPIRSRRGSI